MVLVIHTTVHHPETVLVAAVQPFVAAMAYLQACSLLVGHTSFAVTGTRTSFAALLDPAHRRTCTPVASWAAESIDTVTRSHRVSKSYQLRHLGIVDTTVSPEFAVEQQRLNEVAGHQQKNFVFELVLMLAPTAVLRWCPVQLLLRRYRCLLMVEQLLGLMLMLMPALELQQRVPALHHAVVMGLVSA